MSFLKSRRPEAALAPIQSPQLPALNPVAALSDTIKHLYGELQYGQKHTAARAIRLGEELIKLKDQMKQAKVGGKFTKYVTMELGIPERMAQRCMVKAREKTKLYDALGIVPTDCRVFGEASED
jgi:hypothetical protein